MTYTPQPLDTGSVELPEGIAELSERLAEHIHDVWAQGRIAEGWTFGERRDDEAKTHPGLVPYADLSDSEKDYDRRTAEGSLKAIILLGHRIEK